MNKIYVLEFTGDNQFGGTSHFVIVVAASSSIVARTYVKEKIGIDVDPVLLPNSTYSTIYDRTGKQPLEIQFKILYNGNYQTTNG